MRPRTFTGVVLAISLLTTISFAQAPDDAAAKERQARLRAVLDETIAEIGNLRLPENRAFAYAQAGRALWDDDQKGSRELFQAAAADLVAAIDAAAARKRPNRYADDGSINFRQQVLNTIGEKDAAFALTILERTRPAVVVRALTARDPRDKRITN